MKCVEQKKYIYIYIEVICNKILWAILDDF